MASPNMKALNESIPKPHPLYARTQDVCIICKRPLRASGGIVIAHKECRKKLKHG